MGVHVIAVDVGSVSSAKFAWAAIDHPGEAAVRTGVDPESCVAVLVEAVRMQAPAAFLLEAPVAVPVPSHATGWRGLGRARAGEGNRPWSAGAGTGALATALAQGAWMLGELATRATTVTVTTQLAAWQGGDAQLLLAEAFVSAGGKPVPVPPATGHVSDACAAAREFVRRLQTGRIASDVRCDPERPMNLLAAMAVWAGLRIDAKELCRDVLVVKVMPVAITPAYQAVPFGTVRIAPDS